MQNNNSNKDKLSFFVMNDESLIFVHKILNGKMVPISVSRNKVLDYSKTKHFKQILMNELLESDRGSNNSSSSSSSSSFSSSSSSNMIDDNKSKNMKSANSIKLGFMPTVQELESKDMEDVSMGSFVSFAWIRSVRILSKEWFKTEEYKQISKMCVDFDKYNIDEYFGLKRGSKTTWGSIFNLSVRSYFYKNIPDSLKHANLIMFVPYHWKLLNELNDFMKEKHNVDLRVSHKINGEPYVIIQTSGFINFIFNKKLAPSLEHFKQVGDDFRY